MSRPAIPKVPLIEGRTLAYFGRMTRKQIGKLAKAAREAKGLNFVEAEAFALEKGMKLTRKQIGFIEKGTSNYTIETIIGYARLYGASIDWVDGKPAGKKK